MQSFDSVLLVTAVYLVIDALTGHVRMANAGHPLPLRLPAGGGPTQVLTDPKPGPPLGLVEAPHYANYELQLHPGDRAVVFTDGVYELEGKHGGSFGQSKLRQTLETHASLESEAFLDAVLTTVREHSHDQTFSDDACLLSIGYRREQNQRVVRMTVG